MKPSVIKYRSLRNAILKDLELQLDPKLSYHGLHHTLDVHKVCNGYIRRGRIASHEATLLRTACLLHDYGFVSTYAQHEKAGIKHARRILPQYGYSKHDIDQIALMIMATKIPQKPKNHLSQIICDSDLDYFGRNDFVPIAETLFKEVKHFNGKLSRKEWNLVQYNFLKSHSFHTPYALKYRKPKKDMHIKTLEKWLNRYG